MTLGLKLMVCVVIVVWGRLKKVKLNLPKTFFGTSFPTVHHCPIAGNFFSFQNWIGGGFDYGLQSKWWFWCVTTFFK